MVAFTKNGYLCNIERDTGEPKEQFFERGWFVVSQKPKSLKNFEHTVNLSRVYIQVKYNGATYNKEIMNELEKMILRL